MDEQEVDTQVDTDVEEEGSQPQNQFASVQKNPFVDLASQSFIDYKKRRAEENTQTAQILKQAQEVLLARANPQNSPEMYFRIAAALGKPTKTGAFAESLGYANEALADEAARREKYRQAYEETKLKYQLQQAQLPAASAKENVDYLTKMARIPQPRTAAEKFDIKRQAYEIIQQHKKNPKSVSEKDLKDARILLGLEKVPDTPKPEAFHEKRWAVTTLLDPNATEEQRGLANKVLGTDRAGSVEQQAFGVLEKHRTDPNSVTPEQLKDARGILKLDQPVSDKKAPSARETGQLYTDKHLARAAQEIFGSAIVPENKADRDKVEARAAQYRTDEKNQRISEAREKRPPPKPPKPDKPPIIDLDAAKIVAERFGVPFNDTPYRGISDEAVKPLLVNNTKEAQKTLGGFAEASSKTLKLDNDLDRFLQLNQKNPTGRERSILPSFGAGYQTMEQIQASMAPENRKEGTGAVSDFDAKQLIKMSPSINNNYETNKLIATAIKAANQMARDKAKFMSDYFQANRHLNGANEAWMQYAAANPIFDRNNPSRLNQKRVTYKRFFYPPEQRARGGYMGYSDLATLRDKYAHGGAVRMQTGGTPPESVVRLKPMPPASDEVNRARAYFGQGMGMSFGDEAEALYRSFGDRNKSYDQYLNEIRADYRRFAEENPGQALTFELAGGVSPTIGAMFIPGGQAQTGAQVSRAPGIFKKALEYSTKTPTRRMVTSGAGYGAVSGFGAGEGGIGDRLLEAGESGLIGAAVGPIIGKGGELLYGGGKGIYKRLTKPGTNIIDEQAYAKVLEKMAQDGMTPQQAVRQVALERGYMPDPRAAGTRPRTKLRDVSPGLTDLAEAVAQRPGAGRKKMTEDVVKTGRATKGRVMDITGERMAGGKTMFQTETELTDALRDNAKTLYDDAYKFGTVTDPRILDMLNQPQFKQAYQQVMETNKIRKANAIAKGEDPSKYDMKEIYKITETQPGIYQIDLVAAPDVRTLDQMKRGLDYIIRSGRRSENAAAQDAAHALNEYKNTFLGVLDEVVPAYGVARQQYRGDLEVLDALDIGRNQYSRMSPEEATSYVSKLTPSERDAVRIGYAQYFKDRIGNAKNSINAAEELLGAENNATRLRALFDTQSEYDVFLGILKAESRNVRNAQQVGKGSATGRREQLAKEFESDNAAAQMLDLAGGSPFNTFMRIVKKAPDLFKNEQVASRVADILNTGKAADLSKLLRELESRADKFAMERAKREAIGGTLSRGAGRMAGETPIGADYVEPEVKIPSSVEGENAGVIIPSDYAPPEEEPEAEETVIIQEADEPEDREQMRRGGRVRGYADGGLAAAVTKIAPQIAEMLSPQIKADRLAFEAAEADRIAREAPKHKNDFSNELLLIKVPQRPRQTYVPSENVRVEDLYSYGTKPIQSLAQSYRAQSIDPSVDLYKYGEQGISDTSYGERGGDYKYGERMKLGGKVRKYAQGSYVKQQIDSKRGADKAGTYYIVDGTMYRDLSKLPSGYVAEPVYETRYQTIRHSPGLHPYQYLSGYNFFKDVFVPEPPAPPVVQPKAPAKINYDQLVVEDDPQQNFYKYGEAGRNMASVSAPAAQINLGNYGERGNSNMTYGEQSGADYAYGERGGGDYKYGEKMKRGGKVYKVSQKALHKVKMKMKR